MNRPRFEVGRRMEEIGCRRCAAAVVAAIALAGCGMQPEGATRERPWENSLGMRFVPAGTPGVLFSVWETRQRDWAVFAKEALARAAGRRESSEFFGDDHAMSLTSWVQAKAFCEWLTAKERAALRIGTKQCYRLPTDHEWSVAVGIGDREDPRLSPKAKDGKIAGVYPWGTEWPPPHEAGIYCAEAVGSFGPVGRHAANGFGLFDMGGNLWEWCEDWYDPETRQERVHRGAGYWDKNEERLRSSARRKEAPDAECDDCGFRCVLVVGP